MSLVRDLTQLVRKYNIPIGVLSEFFISSGTKERITGFGSTLIQTLGAVFSSQSRVDLNY